MANNDVYLNECRRRTNETCIWGFQVDYRFLSNFWAAPVFGYPTTEHAFQEAKTLSKVERSRIRECQTPSQAKRLGKTVVMRPDWGEIKFEVMVKLNLEKFTKHPELRAKLLATGTKELVEGNAWHDNIWGDCCCSRCADKPGRNQLGIAIMMVREELKP